MSGHTALKITLRDEQPGDVQAIHDLTAAAFAPKAFSDGTEAAVIDGLRADGDLTLSVVAVKDAVIVGHVACSPVTLIPEILIPAAQDPTAQSPATQTPMTQPPTTQGPAAQGWYGLGPISVQTALQRGGIGSALMHHALSRLKEISATGCVLVGDPKYYTRFGFQSDGKLAYHDLPARNVMWLSFDGTPAHGRLTFSPAFE